MKKRQRYAVMIDLTTPANLKAVREKAKQEQRSVGGYIRNLLAKEGVWK